jgi:NAD-dependent deacetylase
MNTELIQRAAELIQSAHMIVAFTGAGISTPSGIPDFRSDNSGLWENNDPMEVASIYGFRKNPRAFYDWVRPLAQTILGAQPNPAHFALVQLEKLGKLDSIITQNIDMLHTNAGSNTVYELHGHMREVTCIHCFVKYEADVIIQDVIKTSNVPKCPKCKGILKPDVILFGEQLPYKQIQLAKDATQKCDLMIVIGSSLEVYPASDLPVLAHRNNAKIIIINLQPTPLDKIADIIIRDDAAIILPAIMKQLEIVE